MAESGGHSDFRALMVVAVLGAAAVDFIGFSIGESLPGGRDLLAAILVFSFFGFLAAQYSLLALWFVFGPEPLWVRALGALVAASVIQIAIFLAWGDYTQPDLIDDVVRPLAIMPALALVATGLLWPIRAWRGWRLAMPAKSVTTPQATTRQFQIRDLFALTGLVAVALGGLRFALAGNAPGGDAFAALRRDWDEVLIISAVLATLGLLSVLPPLWAAFHLDRANDGLGVLIGYAMVLTFIEVMTIVPGAFGGPDIELVIGVFLAQFMWLSATFAVLRVLKGWGWTLIRPRRKTPIRPGPRGWKPEWPPASDSTSRGSDSLNA
jgi:hypothetical protein